MQRGRFARLVVALVGVTTLASLTPGTAQTAYAARTTTITGSFKVAGTKYIVRAETRLRSVAAVNQAAPTKPSLNPAESSTTITVCNAQGCAKPQNWICIPRPATIDETNNGATIRISSTDADCSVDILASTDQPRSPEVFADRIESVAAAVFEAPKLFGSAAEGTDGKVVRTVSWYTDAVPR